MRFVQAMDKLAAGHTKRLWIIFGSEDHLRAQVRDMVRAATDHRGDRTLMDARENVWLEAAAYSHFPDAERLIEVRGAESFGSSEWLEASAYLSARDIPTTRVVLDIAADELPDIAPLKALVKRSACAQVRCSPLNEDDAVAWLRGFAPVLTKNQAWRILQRTGDPLDARDAARAVHAVVGDRPQVADEVVLLLARSKLVGEFGHALLTGDKPGACELAPGVPVEEYPRIIGLLDVQVEVARRLREVQQTEAPGKAIAELSRTSALPLNLVRDVAHVARHYTDAKARRATTALSVADAAVRQGATTGVLESLTAMF